MQTACSKMIDREKESKGTFRTPIKNHQKDNIADEQQSPLIAPLSIIAPGSHKPNLSGSNLIYIVRLMKELGGHGESLISAQYAELLKLRLLNTIAMRICLIPFLYNIFRKLIPLKTRNFTLARSNAENQRKGTRTCIKGGLLKLNFPRSDLGSSPLS